MKRFIALAIALAVALISVAAQAHSVFNQGLDAGTSSCFEASQPGKNYGAATWASNGDINLASSHGSCYVFINNGNDSISNLEEGCDFGIEPAGTNDASHRGLIIHTALTSTRLLIGSLLDLNRNNSDHPGDGHYGWLTLVNAPPGLASDKPRKTIDPGILLLLGSGLVGLVLSRRRRAGSGSVSTGPVKKIGRARDGPPGDRVSGLRQGRGAF